MLPYSPSIASAFTLATTFFAVDFASLYSFLSLYALVRYQVFSLSFFSLTAFSVSSFHHQLSSPGFFFPDDLPQISSPHVLICLAVSSHHSSTFVVITSIPLDSMTYTPDIIWLVLVHSLFSAANVCNCTLRHSVRLSLLRYHIGLHVYDVCTHLIAVSVFLPQQWL